MGAQQRCLGSRQNNDCGLYPVASNARAVPQRNASEGIGNEDAPLTNRIARAQTGTILTAARPFGLDALLNKARIAPLWRRC